MVKDLPVIVQLALLVVSAAAAVWISVHIFDAMVH